MALTTVNVTGTFNFPDATWATYTTAEFMISGYDTDTEVVVPRVVSAVLGAAGELDVDLWGNDDGLRGTVYRVNIVVYSDSSYAREIKRIDLGRIQLVGDGPLDIANLLDSPVSVPGVWYSTITEAEYDAAIAAAAAAEAAYDSFDDRYLGAKASDPTLDNDGDPLLTGAIYFNTTGNVFRAYNGATWQDAFTATDYVLRAGDTMTGALNLRNATASTLNLQDGTGTTKAQVTYAAASGRVTVQTTGVGGNAIQVTEAGNTTGAIAYVGGVAAASIAPSGTSLPAALSVVTREKGDARFSPLPLDEDDFASDSDTRPPTQQSTKVFVETAIAEGKWVTATPVTAAGQAAIDFSSIPAGVNKIVVTFNLLSTTGSDQILVQIGTGGTPATTGYDSGSISGGTSQSSTAGFIIVSASAAAALSGRMEIDRFNGNIWVASHGATYGGVRAGGGGVTLAGELDIVRIATSGATTFDTGSVNIKYLPG